MYALAEVRWNQILRWGGTVRCSDSELFSTARLEVLPVKSSSSSLQGGSEWGYLDNTKLFTFWICKIKQLNLRHFNTNSTDKFFETVNFFQKEAKTAAKRPILFCLVYQGVFGHFAKIYFRFPRLPKILEDCRRFPKINKEVRPLPKMSEEPSKHELFICLEFRI